MLTKVEPISEKSLKLAKKLILAGEIVAFPTETVYGLGANVFDENAVKKIFAAKNRPTDNPLIAHVSDAAMIDLVAAEITPDAKKIIEKMMPGSLTIVLKKKKTVPDIVTAGIGTVAVRMPLSEEARRFVAACGVPIAAPSANLSTRPSPTTYGAVLEDMDGRIPLILAGEDCGVGIESTVLDLTGEPTVLRPGIVTPSQIESVLGKKVSVLTDPKSKVNSPGVRFRHYAPKIPVALDSVGNAERVTARYDELNKKGLNPVIFCLEIQAGVFCGRNVLTLGQTETDAANRYFSALRDAEKRFGYIIITFCPKTEEGFSVLNRMAKSAGGNLI